ncbi:MAG TPA: ABC transporter substrate-binding protein [Anaerolineales bacterium]|nr:ABC transporter substrate-binding protein [Anaerolineales bacterium]
MTLDAGALLNDRYRLQTELGRGGMAIVYRGRDELLQRDIAVKVVRKPQLTAQDRERLLHEARLAARLNHPNIVAVYDAGQVDEIPYIVMELVEGRSAHEVKPASLDETVAVAAQLCQALAHAHQQGIVHRDLKPENILRTADGAVKLTDFGLALSVASRISRDGILVGTVYYLAPEQVQGLDLDGRTDLYALGVLLYEWTTGVLPFTADEALAVITQHLYAPVIAPRAKEPSVPAALDRLIVRLLSKSPEDRPASADEVLEILTLPDVHQPASAADIDIPILERIGRGRMAGREQELQQARALWSRVLAGGSQTLLIRGEAGIGKTRLVRELIAQAEVSKAHVLQGGNVAQPAQPFGAVRQILRTAFQDLTDSISRCPEFVIADLLTLAPEVQQRYPDISLGTSIGAAYEQERLFESMAVFLAVLSQAAPVLLVIEDAQWSDSGTLYMMRYLAQQTRERRILFVWTFREVEPADSPALLEVLHDFHRDHLATELLLVRLDRTRTEAMLQALFGGRVAPEFADEVFRVTEGNPFFIEEVCKGMAESGRLTQVEGRWHVSGKKRVDVPRNVRLAIQSRVSAMPPATQRALEVAAVRGAEFELEVVRQVREVDEDFVVDALEAAERAEIVRAVSEDGGRRYAFTHSLIPAAMLEDLRAADKRRLHARIAAVLETLQPEAYETLAYHYSAASEREHAVRYLVLAGDRAYALYALPEAIDNYNAALELQRAAQRTEGAVRTLLKLGLVYSADSQFDRAQEAYEQAFVLWESLWRKETPPTEAESPVTLRYAVVEPLSLDPGLAGDDVTSFIIGQVMEGLLEVDEAWGIVPALARRWDVSDDGRRYTFHLRQGWTWSDGHPLTAGDFEYAWKRNLSLAMTSPAGLLLYVLENGRAYAEGRAAAEAVGVRAVDAQTLEVHLDRPATYFPQLLTHPVTFPLPRWAVEGDRQPWTEMENFVGNGPYRLAEWKKGERLTFTRSPGYRGLWRGNAGRIEAPAILEIPPLLEAFDSGALDGISLLNAAPETIDGLRAKYRRRYSSTPVLSTFYLWFDCSRPPFEAAGIRKAFIHAVDREALLRATAGARYRSARGGFLPPGMPGHTPGIGLSYDPERAQLLLAEAGYEGGRGFPEVDLVYTGDPARSPLASFLQRAWGDVLGVVIRPVGVTWADFVHRRDHDPAPIAVSGFSADYPDPDSLLRVLFHSRDGMNSVRWNNRAFDSLTERAAATSDRKERLDLYQQADRILVADEAVVMPLGYSLGPQLAQPYLHVPLTPPWLLRLKNIVVQRPEG